jgi:glycosyltransferase involved in cell wall biosynthesis
MNVYLFLPCYNESHIIRNTIEHYRKNIPSIKITILDNNSSDSSVEIAQSLDCKIVSIDSENIMNEFILTNMRNDVWKNIEDGWVIMCDMDEWLYVSYDDLVYEKEQGTTILSTLGYTMVGESQKDDVSDINISSINRGFPCKDATKNICFLRPHIEEMNYAYGAHSCNPQGIVKYSEKKYSMNHYEPLGLPFLLKKYENRKKRSEKVYEICPHINGHYFFSEEKITNQYNDYLHNKSYIMNIPN